MRQSDWLSYWYAISHSLSALALRPLRNQMATFFRSPEVLRRVHMQMVFKFLRTLKENLILKKRACAYTIANFQLQQNVCIWQPLRCSKQSSSGRGGEPNQFCGCCCYYYYYHFSVDLHLIRLLTFDYLISRVIDSRWVRAILSWGLIVRRVIIGKRNLRLYQLEFYQNRLFALDFIEVIVRPSASPTNTS